MLRIRNLKWVLTIGTVTLSTSVPSSTFKACGSRDLDIGRGFTLTQYLMDKESDYTLRYEPPKSSIKLDGVKMRAPFRLVFSNLDFGDRAIGSLGPYIGFEKYDFRDAQGKMLKFGFIRMECGGGTVLEVDYSSSPPPRDDARNIEFHGLFGDYRYPVRQCLDEIQRFRGSELEIRRSRMETASVSAAAPIPLAFAIRKVRKIWKNQLQEAASGKCSITPHPPPPF